ncbi:MAG: hypothetical protein Q9213_007842 [Squamulea squamosa]
MPYDDYNNKWAWYVIPWLIVSTAASYHPFLTDLLRSEPCIRGHRSSKCEHFDRYMLKVKRPGRPLTQCPHNNRNCDCRTERVIMVRVPHGHPARLLLEAQRLAQIQPHNPPMLPSGQIPPELLYPNYQQHGQNPANSFGVPQPQYMHAIAPQYQPMNFYSDPALMPSAMATAQLARQFDSRDIGMQQQRPLPTEPIDFNQLHHAHPSTHMPHSSSPTPESSNAFSSSPLASLEDCCGDAPVFVDPSSLDSNTHDMEHMTLSSPPQEPLVANAPGSELTVSQQIEDKGKEAEVETDRFQLMNHGAPTTTLYNVPSGYATLDDPMPSDAYAQMQASAIWSQQIPHHAAAGITGSAAPPADCRTACDHLYECNCGSECNCGFCLIHPNNQASRARVREMGRLMLSPNASAIMASEPQFQNGGMSHPATVFDGYAENQSSQAEGADMSPAMMDGFAGGVDHNSYDASFLEQASMEEPTNVDGSATYLSAQKAAPVWDVETIPGTMTSPATHFKYDNAVAVENNRLREKVGFVFGDEIDNGPITILWTTRTKRQRRNWVGG